MVFLVFEGLDGSGKSSLIDRLRWELELRSITYHLTREPGGTALGDELREIILRKTPPHPTPRAELLLYEASRAQHVDEVIRPKLAQGVWVISDRFSASSIAFQAGGRQIPVEAVEALNEFATAGLRPDLTVLLDLTVEESRRRQGTRGTVSDRIESEDDTFHERVRQSFLAQARKEPSRWLVLDASRPIEELAQELLRTLKEKKWIGSPTA
ncbi:MAG: dTMP kinase [Bdellovibrionaceae bacterium]|nr:dTMP kinase [Pseudobdellovibrionaceae bacterium]